MSRRLQGFGGSGSTSSAAPSTTGPHHSPVQRMPVVVVGGQRFAAPARRSHTCVSKRKHAILEFAHSRALTLASSSATPEQLEHLQSAVVATSELAEYGAAAGTLEKDDHAWEYWDRFSTLYGWDPLITPEFASAHPHEVAQRLAIFQSWVYPQLRGRNQPDAKPRTVFNSYVLAIVRIFGRAHVPMPKAKSIERSLAGILRSFKTIYGHEALMPGRKQPFTPSM
mmetsp:Transcript_25601/g.51388  ORF Transcript_25601/g.51388 Transcript_25601/m.51388 type:complete len:225 (-) Transcript_25601:1477-2151(-)